MKNFAVLAILLAASCVGARAVAQETRPVASPQFAAPQRILAGSEPMGQKRLYPSPVHEDMNGDGLRDIVLGDLAGYVTVSTRLPGDGPPRFLPEKRLNGVDGKDLKFDNW